MHTKRMYLIKTRDTLNKSSRTPMDSIAMHWSQPVCRIPVMYHIVMYSVSHDSNEPVQVPPTFKYCYLQLHTFILYYAHTFYDIYIYIYIYISLFLNNI